MSERDYRILTGTAGWKHREWGNEVFYPEELPEDWYLSFYSNEFSVVLVPNEQWLDDSSIEALVAELDEQASADFKCIFECAWTAKTNIRERCQKLLPIAHIVSGLLVQIEIDDLNSQEICDDIVFLNEKFKVCLEVVKLNNALSVSKLNSFCEQHSISLCWNGEAEPIVPDASKLWLARCDSQQDTKAVMQQLKALIAEQFKRESLTREHIIIVDGLPPKVDAVRNAMLMMDIM